MFMYDVDEQDADVPKYLVVMLAFFCFVCLFALFSLVNQHWLISWNHSNQQDDGTLSADGRHQRVLFKEKKKKTKKYSKSCV